MKDQVITTKWHKNYEHQYNFSNVKTTWIWYFISNDFLSLITERMIKFFLEVPLKIYFGVTIKHQNLRYLFILF